MKSTALTLTSEKYFERYAKFITEAEGSPQRITSPEDLDNYDVLVLSGGGDMGIKSGAYGDQTDNLPIGGVNDDWLVDEHPDVVFPSEGFDEVTM